MNANELFNKAVEAYNSATGIPPEEAKSKLSQALYFLDKGIAQDPTAWAYGFKAEVLFALGDFEAAQDAVKNALSRDSNEWAARWINLRLETHKHDQRASRVNKVAGYDSSLTGSLAIAVLGGQYAGWDGIIQAAKKLLDSFRNNFERTDASVNAYRAERLLVVVGLLTEARRGNWKKTSVKILETIIELISPLSSDDKDVEEQLRNVEAIAGGYLIQLK